MPTTTRKQHAILSAAAAPARARAPAREAAVGAMGSTARIVESITSAIVERRLMPGTKLVEQKIADIFKVSRTLVRQALNQLSRDYLDIIKVYNLLGRYMKSGRYLYPERLK